MQHNKKIHFEISERKILLRVIDIFSVLFLLYLLSQFLEFDYFKISKDNFVWTFILSSYLMFFGTIFEMYNLQVASNQFQITKSVLLAGSTTVLFYLLTPFFTPFLPQKRYEIMLFYLAVILALLSWRILYVMFFASTRFVKNAILVCDLNDLQELIGSLQKADPHFKILGYIDIESDSLEVFYLKKKREIDSTLIDNFLNNSSISEIVIASHNTQGLTVELHNKLIKLLEGGIIIREYTQVYESLTQRIPVQYISRDFYRYFPFSRSNNNKLYLLVVRFFEILLALIGLFIGLMILPFIFLGNLIGNRGPLFYTQERVGKNGVNFKIYKLRSMIVDAEKNGAVFASTNDNRVTFFGKFLRKSRLDEVPQFINVLIGDMGIIGPRPERPIFVDKIAEIMPFYETRHIIKPGLTGWAQVNYSYGENLEDSLIKLQYDLYYIKHRSVFLDLSIAVKTLSTILFYRGQ
ncbi:MAG: exopolysaccharide biosynthesis polyprenyl glycosylphosphotransferase [Limnohabitans sp.]|nr:exopolysaccharide biosynthesis polyprenyl glycosylphosphotransferase [Limnohabitans sp.]